MLLFFTPNACNYSALLLCRNYETYCLAALSQSKNNT